MATGLLAFGLFKVRIPDCELWKCFQDETVFLSTQIACVSEREDRGSLAHFSLHPTKSGNSRFCLKAELTAGAPGAGIYNETGLRKPQAVLWRCPWEQVELAPLCSLHCRRLFWDVGQCSCRPACFCPVFLQSLDSLKLRPHGG